MDDPRYQDGRQGWRARRKQRALDRQALRSEFELDPPRRFAALRKLVAEMSELERARIAAHDQATNLRAGHPQPAAARPRPRPS
jgi:hypothetical protein